MSNRFFAAVAIIGIVAGLIALVGSSGGRQEAAPAETAAATAAGPRVAVPPITLPRAAGGTFSSAALRGKSPLILSFFATWCEPCRIELPHLAELYKKHRTEGLQVVAITNEDAAIAGRFAKDAALPFPVLIDEDNSIFRRFQADSIPTLVVLDKQGRAAGACQGYSPEQFDQITALTARLLKE